jgi:hypothetical protein
MTQFPFDPQLVNPLLWPVSGQPVAVRLDSLMAGSMPTLEGAAGLLLFALLAMAAIAWLTAAPARARPTRDGRGHSSSLGMPGAAASL